MIRGHIAQGERHVASQRLVVERLTKLEKVRNLPKDKPFDLTGWRKEDRAILRPILEDVVAGKLTRGEGLALARMAFRLDELDD